jgi:predicted MFS family arabinose efflux permease
LPRTLTPDRPRGRQRSSLLAPFQVRSFRFQWPADLLTSWATEMELVILGWYILVATGSVLLLTLYGALQYFGTLIAPMFGLAGDRFGHRNVLCSMRAVYATMAVLVTVLALTGLISPIVVFVLAAISGLVRPSDLAMRNALVAETMPTDRLMAAMGVARTTSDSARIVGSLAGSGLFALMGMAGAYTVVTAFYAAGFLLTLGVGAPRSRDPAETVLKLSFWRDLREGMAFIADSPQSLAGMWLAFLVNMTAFPMTSGLLPYVAKEVYHIGQTGLGTLVASFAIGALLGSLVVSFAGRRLRPARMMIVFAVAWYVLLLVFVRMTDATSGRLMLVLAGFAQSLSLVPMAVMLLHGAGARFRGRVMGVRMLAIYGLPIGLLVAGALIERIGYTATTSLYCLLGLALTALITVRWRSALWPLDAPANAR